MRDISVIIPTYNRAHCIEKAIKSVLKQTYPVKEVIIADDCSMDNTESVVKKIGDSKIRYFRLTENKGAGGARNYGVSKANCDLIAFHDSDDIWVSTKIERQMEYYEKHMDCDLIYSAYDMILLQNYRHVVPNMEKMDELEGFIFPYLLVRNTIGAPTILMKNSAFREVGGFDETMRSLEDWDFVIRVAKKHRIGFVPEVLTHVERVDNSVSTGVSNYYQNRCFMLRKYKTDYISNNLLNITVQDILEKAQRDNILQQIEKMIILYLA